MSGIYLSDSEETWDILLKRERESDRNKYEERELLQITDLIFYLWRQIPASCAVSSYGTCQCAGV